MSFKKGDRIRCVRADGSGQPGLMLGQIYTVHTLTHGRVILKETATLDWYLDRFKLVTGDQMTHNTSMKNSKKGDWVECKDAEATGSNREGNRLTVGKRYQVIERSGPDVIVTDDKGTQNSFDLERFDLIGHDDLDRLIVQANVGLQALYALKKRKGEVMTIDVEEGSKRAAIDRDIFKALEHAAVGYQTAFRLAKSPKVFEEFTLKNSGYLVSVDCGVLAVGCQKSLDLVKITKGLRDLLENNANGSEGLRASRKGVKLENVSAGLTWDDAQQLYNALKAFQE